MNRKIKIGFISYGLDVGGIETLILEICKRLPKDRYSLCVFEFQGNGKLQQEFEQIGVKVHTVKKIRNLDWSLPFKLAKLFKQQGIDIVHAHDQSPWLYAGIAAKFAGVPVVYTEHTTPDITIYQNVNRWKRVEKALSMITKQITAVADSVARYMIDEAGISAKKVKVIYNGIDAKIYDKKADIAAKRKELGIKETDLIVGNVASLLPKKDPKTLLEAFKLVIQQVPNAKLVMAGDGLLKEQLMAMKDNLGLNGSVKFLGNRRDIPELLQVFDVFALSSVKEGLPIAILEAMASGLAVVATDVDGNAEVVQHGKTGFIVPARNPVALAEDIVKLLLDKDEAKKMGFLAQERVKNYFTFEKMIAEYENVYNAVLRN
ncbi:MAG: GT4 family glycosyltransferase PelF [Candidatus Omnitrophica bacterium]|nr:GT4 family glycosyltransferase PelF [Candidatus Omnitrophota bacterium]